MSLVIGKKHTIKVHKSMVLYGNCLKTWYYYVSCLKHNVLCLKPSYAQKYGVTMVRIVLLRYTYVYIYLFLNMELYHHTFPKTCYYHGIDWPPPPKRKKTKQNMVLPGYMPKTLVYHV